MKTNINSLNSMIFVLCYHLQGSHWFMDNIQEIIPLITLWTGFQLQLGNNRLSRARIGTSFNTRLGITDRANVTAHERLQLFSKHCNWQI